MKSKKILLFLIIFTSTIFVGCSSSEFREEIQRERFQMNPDENISVSNFYIEAGNFTFSESELVVSKGDLVRIQVKSTDNFQDFIIEDLNVDSYLIPEGSSRTVEFLAEERGEFEFFSSIRSNRAQGMRGVLIVE